MRPVLQFIPIHTVALYGLSKSEAINRTLAIKDPYYHKLRTPTGLHMLRAGLVQPLKNTELVANIWKQRYLWNCRFSASLEQNLKIWQTRGSISYDWDSFPQSPSLLVSSQP